MCGISGIVKKDKSAVTLTEIKKITDLIKHRGPDDEGFLVEENLGLGHRRLSILDLSSSGHQPMYYLDKYVVVFNGEIYNYLEIKATLVKEGYIFKSKTDTEVLLAAYDRWGSACINNFNGMWAFVIYDKDKSLLFCSRDRFGVKPFYYYHTNNYFAFGSEIKVFTGLENWEAILNIPKALDFLESGIFDHTEETFFQNVKQLRGGYNLYYDLTQNVYYIENWYDLSNKIKPYTGSFDQAKQEFTTIFENALRLRLRSDVKVGSCLSGGLDSSSIVCTLNRMLSQSGKEGLQETVSSCFNNKKYDEQIFIDKVVQDTNVISHKVFPAFEELFERLEEIIWHQDEPFSSTSIYAQWHVFKEARKHNLIVMLDGQGADETLAGYSLFYDAYFAGLLKKGKMIALMQELQAYKKLYKYTNRKLFQFLVKGFTPASLAGKMRRHYFDESVNIVKSNVTNSYPNRRPASTFQSIYSASIDQLLYSNLPMLLHFEDRNSMAHSIESRVPFLDYKLVEFIVSLPDSYKIKQGKTKYILRESMQNVIPAEIKNRYDKMGFVTPEAEWFKNNASMIREKLVEATEYLQDFLDGESILIYYDRKVKSGSDATAFITRVLIFYMWIKKFNLTIRK